MLEFGDRLDQGGGARQARVLSISAQKPDGTGSGTFLSQTVAAQVRQGCETAVICGIGNSDSTAALPGETAVYPVRFMTDELPFHVCGISDEMSYAAILQTMGEDEGWDYLAKLNENIPFYAKLFIEWLFSSDDNLHDLADIDKKTTLLLALPTVSGIELDFDTSQLMEEDLTKFGSAREATLAKWDEVTSGKEVVSSK